MPYHVMIVGNQDKSRTEVALALTEDDVRQRFSRPYLQGQDILISGRTINARDVFRIKITHTDELPDELRSRAEIARKDYGAIPVPSIDYFIARQGKDVT